jgi:hypothetical protein
MISSHKAARLHAFPVHYLPGLRRHEKGNQFPSGVGLPRSAHERCGEHELPIELAESGLITTTASRSHHSISGMPRLAAEESRQRQGLNG